MIKKIFFCVIFCLLSFTNFAQECNNILKGIVIDYHDGTPIYGATIYIKSLNKYVTSDFEGKFKIEKLCIGEINLTISHIACETKEFTINISSDIYKEFNLEHHIEELKEVSISSSSSLKSKTIQSSILKENIIDKYSNQSLGDALKEVAGVSSINTGNSIVKPMINGLHSSRIIIMNNGVRQQDQEWGIEHAPNIDINSANQITIIKGSGALAYGGDAIGGVVVMSPKKIIRKDTLYGKTIFGGQTNGRGYNVTSTLSKNYKSGWFATLQGSYKKNGDFNAPDYSLTNTGLESKSFATRLGKNNFESGFEISYSYINNEIGILGAAHIGSIFDLQRAINSGEPFLVDDFSYQINPPKQQITHQLAKASYYKRIKSFGKIKVQYDYQNNKRLEFDIRIGDNRNVPAINLLLQTHTVLVDLNVDHNSDRKYNFGITGRYQDNFASPDTGVRRLIPDYDKYDFGIYTTTEWRLEDNLIIDAGLRYDFNRIDAKKFYRKNRWQELGYDIDFPDIIIRETATQFLTNPAFNYHNFSASAGLKFLINDNSNLIVNYALSSRPPNPSELFSDGLHHSAARFELGNIRFGKEVSNRVATSYNYNKGSLNFITEIFYNKIDNFLFLKPFALLPTNRGPYPIWNYEQTDANLFGLDMSATYDLTDNWQWQNKTAYIKGYNLTDDEPLINIPALNTLNQIKYTNKSWYNFSASLQSEWVFEQNEFPDFNFDVLDQFTGEAFEVDISTPPPAYHLLHFYSKATFDLSKKTSLNVALGINNLLNTSYRNYLNQLRFFADDLGRNITLQLQFNF
jgi:iron complex outermembrane receptor protein